MLNQKSESADKDYKIQIAQIGLQAERNRITEAYNNGQLTAAERKRKSDAAIARYNAQTGRQNANTSAQGVVDDAAMDAWKRAHPGQTPGSTATGGTSGLRSGQRHYVVGRNGKTVTVSNTVFNQDMQKYRKLQATTAGIRDALKGGASDMEKVRKHLGVDDRRLFELAVGIVRRGRAKYTIERKHLPYLKALFPSGYLPKDIADRVVPK